MNALRTVGIALATVLVLVALIGAPAAGADVGSGACEQLEGSQSVDLRSLGGDPAGDTRPALTGSTTVDLRALGGDPVGSWRCP